MSETDNIYKKLLIAEFEQCENNEQKFLSCINYTVNVDNVKTIINNIQNAKEIENIDFDVLKKALLILDESNRNTIVNLIITTIKDTNFDVLTEIIEKEETNNENFEKEKEVYVKRFKEILEKYKDNEETNKELKQKFEHLIKASEDFQTKINYNISTNATNNWNTQPPRGGRKKSLTAKKRVIISRRKKHSRKTKRQQTRSRRSK